MTVPGTLEARPRLPCRAALAELFAELGTRRGTSAGGLLDRLIGREQLWWKCCQEAVREDPDWLFQDQVGSWRDWINKNVPDGSAAGPHPADLAYLVAQALCGAPGSPEAHVEALELANEAWNQARLLPPGALLGGFAAPDQMVPDAPERVQRRLAYLVDAVSGGRVHIMVGLTALLLAGAERRKRPVVRVSVVFDRVGHDGTGRDEGVAGVLELRELKAGPVGLFPDPQAMAGARSTGQSFTTSLSHAWHASPWSDRGRCVLWRLVLPGHSSAALQISGGSLGAAFALGLRELFRHPVSNRPSAAGLRAIVYGLRPGTAVTGCLDAAARLARVGGLGAKLQVAQRKRWQLVVPEENRADISEPPASVKFAATLRQAERYARQWRTARLVTAAAILMAAVTSGTVVSNIQATAATRKQTAAQLANVSAALLNTDTGLAQLFATQAYHHDPTPQTRAALLQAVTASPHLVRSLQADGPIAATAASGDGHTVAAGTKGGKVLTWRPSGGLGDAPRQQAATLDSAVKMIAIDADGDTGAAMDATAVRIWSSSRSMRSVGLPPGQRPTAVAVSPSGHYVAVTMEDDLTQPRLLLVELATGRIRDTVLKDMSSAPDRISAPDDGQLVLLDEANGSWARMSVPELKHLGGSAVGFGAHNYGSALSANGGYFTYSNAGTSLPLWTTRGSPDYDRPTLTAATQGTNPVALALSADGSRVAQGVNTTIYVSVSVRSAQDRQPPTALTGAGPLLYDSLAFVGPGNDRLLSASGDLLTLWDLSQVSRIGAASDAIIPESCNGCYEPRIGVQPGNRNVAVVDGNGSALNVQALGPHVTHRWTERAAEGRMPAYGPPLWTSDGTKIILVSARDDSAQIRSFAPGLPSVGSWSAPGAPPHQTDAPTLLQMTSTGRQVVEIGDTGTVKLRDVTTGQILRRIQGPAGMTPTMYDPSPLPPDYAAANASATYAAVIDRDNSQVHVTDIAAGKVQVIHGKDARGVAFVRDKLLIQLSSGVLEIWDASGRSRTATLRGVPDSVIGPVVNGVDTIVETDSDSTVTLIDYPSGQRLGTLPVPKGYKATSIGLGFAPGGKTLVSATEVSGDGVGLVDGGTVVGWRVDDGAWLGAACHSAGRDLTADQWRQYMGGPAPPELHCPAP